MINKSFASLRILILFIKSFVIAFVDIALTFFDNSFNLFLFEVTFFNLLSKPDFFARLATSLLLAKFASVSFAVKLSHTNLLNY